MSDKWMINGMEFGNCNCAWGCPCQFSAPTTHPGLVAAEGSPMINPFSGEPARARIHLPHGFEYTYAEVGRSVRFGWGSSMGRTVSVVVGFSWDCCSSAA